MRKLTYKYVKEYIESYGYTLLSEEYVNANTKLKVMCSHGHIYEVKFGNFQQGQRCKTCSINNKVNNQRLTQEFVEKEFDKREYKLLNKYVNSKTQLILEDKNGYLYVTTWDGFKQGCDPHMIISNNPYSIQNIQHYLDLNLKGYKLLSEEYKSAKSELEFMCNKGHKFTSNWDNISRGSRCKECTCIAVTDPWMIPYFKNKEDAYNYSSGSGVKITVICPCCGKEKEITIKSIYERKSIACTCGDGISYPEKFIISMLNQLNIKYTKEYKPSWSDNRRYDFYLEDYNCIIECHGGQHYNKNGFKTYGGRTLQEEQENDKYKKELALSNNIKNYIILDCRESNIEYIKNSILNSELSEIVDLSKIDWLQCEEFALSNKVKEVCNYWHLHNEVNNENLTTTDISKVFNISKNSTISNLKNGSKLGWCNYNPKEEMKKCGSNNGKVTSKPVEIFKNGESLGIFESCAELERQSEELFGVKLLQYGISSVCRGEQKTHRGYTFKYITKEEYEERIKQIKNNN